MNDNMKFTLWFIFVAVPRAFIVTVLAGMIIFFISCGIYVLAQFLVGIL